VCSWYDVLSEGVLPADQALAEKHQPAVGTIRSFSDRVIGVGPDDIAQTAVPSPI
jgi:hypothetical protein